MDYFKKIKVPKSPKWARRRARKRVLRREKMLSALARPGAEFLREKMRETSFLRSVFLEG